MSALFHPRKRARELQLSHALRGVPLFADLPAQDLVAIWRCLVDVRLPADHVLFERGDAADRFYIVQAGALEVRLGLGPDAVILRRVGPGDYVGELALLTGQPRSADVVALEDAVLWALDPADFAALLAGSPVLLRALNRALSTMVGTLTLRLGALMADAGPLGARAALTFGPYQAVAQLGSGGMGVVYSAVDRSSGTEVAIKVLPAAWSQAGDFAERLRREAAALQGLDHPNIVTLIAVGELAEDAGVGCYLAMEWLPNALDRVLRAQYPAPLASADGLRLAHGIACGLEAVHRAGMIHRDVKPSNILLREDGTPVLTDFGLVTQLVADGQRLTASNVIVGTADYLAPEQIAGLPVDGRADLYALGVVLYELLTGTVPFGGREPLATLRAQVEEAPPPLPSQVPDAARAIVEQAMQKRPRDRYPSAASMAQALAAAIEQLGPSSG